MNATTTPTAHSRRTVNFIGADQITLNKRFVEIVTKTIRRDSGANSLPVADFLQIVGVLLSYQSFTFENALHLARAKDLEPDDMRILWQFWTRQMVDAKRIEEIFGCYEMPIYRPV